MRVITHNKLQQIVTNCNKSQWIIMNQWITTNHNALNHNVAIALWQCCDLIKRCDSLQFIAIFLSVMTTLILLRSQLNIKFGKKNKNEYLFMSTFCSIYIFLYSFLLVETTRTGIFSIRFHLKEGQVLHKLLISYVHTSKELDLS